MKIKIPYTVLFLFLALGHLFGQEYGYIEGKLVDTQTNEPVVFATIRLKDKEIGVISNLDGGFKIPLDLKELGEELEISCMGYQSKEISLSSLLKNEMNTIGLAPALEQLNEVVVTEKRKRLTSKKVVRYALERIPTNYDNDLFSLFGYYRDYQLRNGEYINLNEAIVEISDTGFADKNYVNTQYYIYKYLKNNAFKTDSLATKPYDYTSREKYIPNAVLGKYVSNELILLYLHDAIRNNSIKTYSFVYALVEDFVKGHQFKKLQHTSYGNQAVYQIDFKKWKQPFKAEGSIYIDKDDYAIRKLSYAVYAHKLIDPEMGIYSSDEKDLVYETVVEYKEVNKKMYLNYISFHNKFKIVRPPKFRVVAVSLDTISKQLDITLNKPAVNSRLRPEDIDIAYRGKKMRVKQVFEKTKQNYRIGFFKNDVGQAKLINSLVSESSNAQESNLKIEIPTLKDEDRNILGFRETELLNQYREFFTQNVIEGVNASNKNLAPMKKGNPLYDPSQPIHVLPNSQSYWLNTPLRNTIE